MIKVQDLSFSYSQLTIFEEVSFSFYSHHITVIKGESGSGKTTMLDLLSLRYGVCFDIEYNGQSIVCLLYTSPNAAFEGSVSL